MNVRQNDSQKLSQKEDSLLEFDSLNSLKTNKKKEKKSSEKEKSSSRSEVRIDKKSETISEHQPKKGFMKKSRQRSSSLSSDSDEELKDGNDEDGDNGSLLSDPSEYCEVPVPKPLKESSKIVRSDPNHGHDKKTPPNECDPFMEFDNVSSLKVVKKAPEKRLKIPEKVKRSHLEECKAADSEKIKSLPIKTQENKQNEHINARKRSSSLSSDSEDELQEDGEVVSSSPNSPINVPLKTKQTQLCKEELNAVKNKYKDKKNKHKAQKKEIEDGYKTKSCSNFVSPTASYSDGDDVSKSLKIPVKEEISVNIQLEHASNQLDFASLSSSQNTPSNSVKRQQNHFSGSSTEDATNIVSQELGIPTDHASNSVLPADHLRFMLNLYSKIHQLQKTNDKSTITEVVNILSSDGKSTMNLKEDNVSFDLVNCDIETLRSIDNLLL